MIQGADSESGIRSLVTQGVERWEESMRAQAALAVAVSG